MGILVSRSWDADAYAKFQGSRLGGLPGKRDGAGAVRGSAPAASDPEAGWTRMAALAPLVPTVNLELRENIELVWFDRILHLVFGAIHLLAASLSQASSREPSCSWKT